ncbi:FHIPEP family type III secretion protein [Vibrio chagasii]|nr:FHIPEP family type III secretion protein [Vibrio chagasii]
MIINFVVIKGERILEVSARFIGCPTREQMAIDADLNVRGHRPERSEN